MVTNELSIDDVMETMADSMAYATYLRREQMLGNEVTEAKQEAAYIALENALLLYFEFRGISLNG